MSNLEYVELYPKVDVYRNVLKDPQQLYDVMKDSERNANGEFYLKTWDPWAHFGTYTQHKGSHEITPEMEQLDKFKAEKAFVDEVEAAYAAVIADYVERHNVEMPEGWRFSGCSFSKYNPQVDVLKNKMTMQYHTDFIISQRDMPGTKFFLTCTMYINDDYEGGDIEFYIDGDGTIINHKPKAGDILVFPSTDPYFHGVKVINEAEKFFVRNFVVYDYDGSEEWLANQKRFGAYAWSKKELERIEEEDKKNMIYLKDGARVEHKDAYANRDQGGM
jgi:hypothetical protein